MCGITHNEKHENLLILLEGEDALPSLTVANLQISAEAIAAMPQNMATGAIDKLNNRIHEAADINEMHAVIW